MVRTSHHKSRRKPFYGDRELKKLGLPFTSAELNRRMPLSRFERKALEQVESLVGAGQKKEAAQEVERILQEDANSRLHPFLKSNLDFLQESGQKGGQEKSQKKKPPEPPKVEQSKPSPQDSPEKDQQSYLGSRKKEGKKKPKPEKTEEGLPWDFDELAKMLAGYLPALTEALSRLSHKDFGGQGYGLSEEEKGEREEKDQDQEKKEPKPSSPTLAGEEKGTDDSKDASPFWGSFDHRVHIEQGGEGKEASAQGQPVESPSSEAPSVSAAGGGESISPDAASAGKDSGQGGGAGSASQPEKKLPSSPQATLSGELTPATAQGESTSGQDSQAAADFSSRSDPAGATAPPVTLPLQPGIQPAQGEGGQDPAAQGQSPPNLGTRQEDAGDTAAPAVEGAEEGEQKTETEEGSPPEEEDKPPRLGKRKPKEGAGFLGAKKPKPEQARAAPAQDTGATQAEGPNAPQETAQSQGQQAPMPSYPSMPPQAPPASMPPQAPPASYGGSAPAQLDQGGGQQAQGASSDEAGEEGEGETQRLSDDSNQPLSHALPDNEPKEEPRMIQGVLRMEKEEESPYIKLTYDFERLPYEHSLSQNNQLFEFAYYKYKPMLIKAWQFIKKRQLKKALNYYRTIMDQPIPDELRNMIQVNIEDVNKYMEKYLRSDFQVRYFRNNEQRMSRESVH